jgi:O-antigen/teichoic acid export membrane protein
VLPILVIGQIDASANAYYYLTWTVAFPLLLLAMHLATSLMVEGVREAEQLARLTRQMLIQAVRLIVPIVGLVLIGAPYILRLFGEAYAAEGTTLLRLIALAALPYSINAIYMTVSRVQSRMGRVIVIEGTLTALTLGLSYLLLDRIGIAGIGWAWLVSHSVVAAIVWASRLRTLVRPVAQLAGDSVSA